MYVSCSYLCEHVLVHLAWRQVALAVLLTVPRTPPNRTHPEALHLHIPGVADTLGCLEGVQVEGLLNIMIWAVFQQ